VQRRPHHRRSFRSARPSTITPVAIAITAGLVAGIGVLFAFVSARLGAASEWMAIATPAWAALSGGLLTCLLLHLFKVSDRDVIIGSVVTVAAPAFALGHLSRLFDPAAALASEATRTSLTFWLRGYEWLESAPSVIASAPGLRPVTAVIGVEGSAALAMCELLVVCGLLLAAVDRALAAPLCASCRRWCRREPGAIRRSAAAPLGLVIQRATARDWHFFRELGAPRARSALRIDLACCPTCDRMSAFSVALTRPLRAPVPLVRDIRLGPDDLRTVREMAGARPRARSNRPGSVPAFLPRG
jgi:hypothetical protein